MKIKGLLVEQQNCRYYESRVLKSFKYFSVFTLRTGGRCELCVVASAGLTKEKIPRGQVQYEHSLICVEYSVRTSQRTWVISMAVAGNVRKKKTFSGHTVGLYNVKLGGRCSNHLHLDG